MFSLSVRFGLSIYSNEAIDDEMKHLYGVTTAMVTPFDENGRVELIKWKT
ncbi:hypothetical protein [Peribacillus butanolivorans]